MQNYWNALFSFSPLFQLILYVKMQWYVILEGKVKRNSSCLMVKIMLSWSTWIKENNWRHTVMAVQF